MAADNHTKPDITALRKLEASIQLDMLEQVAASQRCFRQPASPRGKRRQHAEQSPARRGLAGWHHSLMRVWARWRRVSLAFAAGAGAVMIGMLALWWRLGSGPIDFD